MIISNRLVRLTERECRNSTREYVVFDIGDFFNAKDIRYRDSELGTTHISAFKNYTELSTISRYVSRFGETDGAQWPNSQRKKAFRNEVRKSDPINGNKGSKIGGKCILYVSHFSCNDCRWIITKWTRITIALAGCDRLIQHNNGTRRNARDKRVQALPI